MAILGVTKSYRIKLPKRTTAGRIEVISETDMNVLCYSLDCQPVACQTNCNALVNFGQRMIVIGQSIIKGK